MNISDFPNEPWRAHRQKTGLEKLQEELQRQLTPARQMQEMHDLLRRFSPEYQMKEILDRVDPHRQIREMLEHTAVSKQVQDMFNSSSIASQTQRMAEGYFQKNLLGTSDSGWRRLAAQDPADGAVKLHEQYLRPLSQQQEWLANFQRQALGGLSFQDFARQIEQKNPTLAAIEEAKKSLDSMWGQFREINFSQFELNDEDKEDAEQAVNSIGNSATEGTTLQGSVDQIIAVIQAQQKPSVQLMLWLLFRKMLDWLIAGVIGAAISYYAPAVLGDSPQAANKAVKELAREAIGAPQLLTEYRYVSATVLVVRQNPKSLSPEVGRLKFGKPVKLIKRNKDFALVLWSDKESGTEIQGWVFARYLERFN
jgi:Bacterial SH3 domain